MKPAWDLGNEVQSPESGVQHALQSPSLTTLQACFAQYPKQHIPFGENQICAPHISDFVRIHLWGAEMGWAESTKPSDLWKQTREPDHLRAGKDPKGHFTDEETEVNWFARGHTAIYQQCQAGLPRGREPQGSLLRKICQQLATNLLTGDLSPCVSNETEVMRLLRKEHKACPSSGSPRKARRE